MLSRSLKTLKPMFFHFFSILFFHIIFICFHFIAPRKPGTHSSWLTSHRGNRLQSKQPWPYWNRQVHAKQAQTCLTAIQKPNTNQPNDHLINTRKYKNKKKEKHRTKQEHCSWILLKNWWKSSEPLSISWNPLERLSVYAEPKMMMPVPSRMVT